MNKKKSKKCMRLRGPMLLQGWAPEGGGPPEVCLLPVFYLVAWYDNHNSIAVDSHPFLGQRRFLFMNAEDVTQATEPNGPYQPSQSGLTDFFWTEVEGLGGTQAEANCRNRRRFAVSTHCRSPVREATQLDPGTLAHKLPATARGHTGLWRDTPPSPLQIPQRHLAN